MSPDHKLTTEDDWAEQKIRISTSYNSSPKSGNFHFNPEVYSLIVQYCQEQGIPLILVWLPHETCVYNAYWYAPPYNEAWFRKQFEEYSKKPGVFPVYLNTLPQDCALYSDYRHLSNYGCIKASELFAETLMQPRYRNLIASQDPSHKQ